MGRPGPPFGLNHDLIERIVARVTLGASASAAGVAEGVDPSRMTRYLRRGTDGVDERGQQAPDGEETDLCKELAQRVNAARELGIQGHLRNIAHCATVEAEARYDRRGKQTMPAKARDWRASVAFLKLTAPDRFRDSIEIDQTTRGSVVHGGRITLDIDRDLERMIAEDPEAAEKIAEAHAAIQRLQGERIGARERPAEEQAFAAGAPSRNGNGTH